MKRRIKKMTIALLIFVFLVTMKEMSISHANSIPNVMSCRIFQKDSVPDGYFSIIGLAAGGDDGSGHIGNGHLSELSSNQYTHIIACNTKGYATLKGVVLDPNQKCEDFHYAYVINMSDKVNAHVKSPYSGDGYSKYNNELCIDLSDIMSGLNGYVYCDVKDKCSSEETCLFKFNGKISSTEGFVDSNAHVYDCNYHYLSEAKAVCCKLSLNTEGEIVVDLKSSLISQNETYIQLGMYGQIIISLFNPSDKPQTITLKLDSTNDENGKIFKNFVWFNNGGVTTREQTIKLQPYGRDYTLVNIFGGKVGKYKLFVNKIKDGKEINLYSINVTVIPSFTKGISKQSPEFGEVFMFAILITSIVLLYRKM